MNAQITKTPGVCGGKACLAGHRIRVLDIVVWHEKRGYSPEEVVALFPGITPANVQAALTYYAENRAEIDEDFRRDADAAEWLTANLPSKISSELREKIGG